MNSNECSGRDRTAKMKRCKRCEYNGRVNGDGICGSCCQDVVENREVCPACKHWVEEGGVECTRCCYWRHKQCAGLTDAGLKVVKNMDVWFCTSCSEEWKTDKEETERMRKELKGLQDKNLEINEKVKDIEEKCASWSKDAEKYHDVDSPSDWGLKKGEKEIVDPQKTGISNFVEEIKNLKKAHEEFKNMIVDIQKKWESREEEIIRKVMDKVVEHIEETQEKEKKKNIIMFNVPESNKDEIRENT